MNQIRILTGLLAVWVSAGGTLASAPTIIEAAAKGNPNGFNLTFSEPVDPATATNPANYSVNGGVLVTGASLLYGTNETTIVVHTTDLTGTGPFTVTVNGVRDQEQPANEIVPNSTALIRRAGLGVLERSFGGINGGAAIGGTTLADLHAAFDRFPDRPDIIQIRPELSIVPFRSHDYGSQLVGYLEVAVTGDYRFHVAAHNQAILFLSTDATAEHKQPIAGEPIRGYRLDYLTFSGIPRTFNAAGDDLQTWIATNFPARASDDAMVNDSLSAFGQIHLEAGKRYYIEALVKCGFSDMLDITWQRPGDAAVTNGQPAIVGDYLSPLPRSTDGAVLIIQHPGPTVTVHEGGQMVIGAVHVGTEPFEYQWFRGSEPLAGATAQQLTLPFVNMDDNGAEFHVRIRNAFSEVNSEVAVLSIIPDTDSPTVVRAVGSHQFDRLTITFSEELDPVTAANPANYQVEPVGGGVPLAVLGIELRSELVFAERARVITHAFLRTEAQIPGTRYRITMTDLRDRAAPPHPLAEPARVEFPAWVLSPGFVLRETFGNEASGPIELFDFDAFARFPPLHTAYNTEVEFSEVSTFLTRFVGLVQPQISGDHQFALSSSGAARLYLDQGGADQPPALLASTEQSFASFYRKWGFTGPLGAHLSPPVSLLATERYPFALSHAASANTSHLGMNWHPPGQTAPANGSPTLLRGKAIAGYADPDWALITISEHPQGITTNEYAAVTLTVAASASPSYGGGIIPLLYQWQQFGIDIPGAVSNRLSLVNLTPQDAGNYRCRVSAPGKSVFSGEATVSVIPHPLPEVEVAYALPDRQKVIVRFTSRIGGEMAGTPGVFTIPGLTIESVSIGPDLDSVELMTSLQTAGQIYTVNVHAIFDFDGTPVDLPVLPAQVNFTGPVLTPGYVLREIYTNIIGGWVADLTNHVSFPDHPGIREYLPGLDYPHPAVPVYNSGVRLSGWITPPLDGSYDFYIAADNQAVLYLSSDETPANKLLIAVEPEWNNYRAFASDDRRVNTAAGQVYFPGVEGLPLNRTANIVGPRNLLASKRYYIEVLKKKGGGGNDHVSVAMVPAGNPPPANGTPGISGASVASYLSPDNRITITQQPQSITVPNPHQQGQFSVGAIPLVAGPLTFQWFQNGVPIPGAVGGSVTVQPGLPGSGIPVTCRISAPGAPDVMSEPAYFVVEPVAIGIGRTGDLWQLNLPYLNGSYRVERATNFPPTGGWQFLQDVPGYLGGWQFEQEFPTEFFRVELREP